MCRNCSDPAFSSNSRGLTADRLILQAHVQNQAQHNLFSILFFYSVYEQIILSYLF